jgi:hypothetical protein
MKLTALISIGCERIQSAVVAINATTASHGIEARVAVEG